MQGLKARIRRLAYDARNAQVDKEQLSLKICHKLIKSDTYLSAETVMCYLHCRSEVSTAAVLAEALPSEKKVVIPYCTRDSQGNPILGLWHLRDLSELTLGTWGIMEPPEERRGEKNRQINPERLDLIIVPGVGFDREGGRIGNGMGYYDRLLSKVRIDAVLIAVCFESQLFPEIPMHSQDVYMDYVYTEANCYPGRGRRASKNLACPH
jgi:5-formyltetrahydrofolate cyclo-ligase